MKRKNIFSVLLVLVMLLSMAQPALAADTAEQCSCPPQRGL